MIWFVSSVIILSVVWILCVGLMIKFATSPPVTAPPSALVAAGGIIVGFGAVTSLVVMLVVGTPIFRNVRAAKNEMTKASAAAEDHGWTGWQREYANSGIGSRIIEFVMWILVVAFMIGLFVLFGLLTASTVSVGLQSVHDSARVYGTSSNVGVPLATVVTEMILGFAAVVVVGELAAGLPRWTIYIRRWVHGLFRGDHAIPEYPEDI